MVVFYFNKRVASCSLILPSFFLSILLNYYNSSCNSPLACYCILIDNINFMPAIHYLILLPILYYIIMFYSLAQHNNLFVRPQKSNLVLAVPLCARTVIFFCDDLTFYHYSLIENKILYQSKLPGRIIQAISLSGHQIICTINQCRALMVLNIQQRSLEQICKLPQTKIHNENKQKDIFTQTKLHIFEKTNFFYIEQPRREENKTKIYFYGKSAKEDLKIKVDDFSVKEINTRRHLLAKFDSERRLVLFKQQIDDNGVFKFSTIDCCKDFVEIQYACANEAFTRAAIVREVRLISPEDDPQNKVMIFVNSSTPQILIFSNNEIQDFGYKPNKMLYSTILINASLGFGMFMFMPDRDESNPNYENVIELLDLKSAKVLERIKLTVKQVVKSWEDDYFLLYRQELHPSNSSSFETQNIISKKAFYMKFLWQKGFSDYSEAFMSEIIGMLE